MIGFKKGGGWRGEEKRSHPVLKIFEKISTGDFGVDDGRCSREVDAHLVACLYRRKRRLESISLRLLALRSPGRGTKGSYVGANHGVSERGKVICCGVGMMFFSAYGPKD